MTFPRFAARAQIRHPPAFHGGFVDCPAGGCFECIGPEGCTRKGLRRRRRELRCLRAPRHPCPRRSMRARCRSSERLTLTLTLAPSAERAAALDQFLTAVRQPSSPSYHKWMTPAGFAASFGATADQVAAASEWAQANGPERGCGLAGGGAHQRFGCGVAGGSRVCGVHALVPGEGSAPTMRVRRLLRCRAARRRCSRQWMGWTTCR